MLNCVFRKKRNYAKSAASDAATSTEFTTVTPLPSHASSRYQHPLKTPSHNQQRPLHFVNDSGTQLNFWGGAATDVSTLHYFHPRHSPSRYSPSRYSHSRYSLNLILLTLVIINHYSHIMLVQFKQSLARTFVLLSLPVRL